MLILLHFNEELLGFIVKHWTDTWLVFSVIIKFGAIEIRQGVG